MINLIFPNIFAGHSKYYAMWANAKKLFKILIDLRTGKLTDGGGGGGGHFTTNKFVVLLIY